MGRENIPPQHKQLNKGVTILLGFSPVFWDEKGIHKIASTCSYNDDRCNCSYNDYRFCLTDGPPKPVKPDGKAVCALLFSLMWDCWAVIRVMQMFLRVQLGACSFVPQAPVQQQVEHLLQQPTEIGAGLQAGLLISDGN